MSDLDRLEKLLVPTPIIEGVTVADHDLDEEEIWRQAVQSSRKVKAIEERQRTQRISFESGPVCVVCLADIHAGGEGVDYDRLNADLALINNTPGMYIMLVGDLLDNFIIGRLALLMMERKFKISEEWALVRYIAAQVAPKLIAVVSGNHDKWTAALSGIDYFREVWREQAAHVLYDTDDLSVDIHVGPAVYRWRARHKWRGTSIYNPTHGIERAAKFDGGNRFDVGIGAHTHVSGVSRFFNNGGKTGLAVLVGTYKFYDIYAKTGGFPKPNEQTAQAIIVDDNGDILVANSLQTAARYMRRMYG